MKIYPYILLVETINNTIFTEQIFSSSYIILVGLKLDKDLMTDSNCLKNYILNNHRGKRFL